MVLCLSYDSYSQVGIKESLDCESRSIFIDTSGFFYKNYYITNDTNGIALEVIGELYDLWVDKNQFFIAYNKSKIKPGWYCVDFLMCSISIKGKNYTCVKPHKKQN